MVNLGFNGTLSISFVEFNYRTELDEDTQAMILEGLQKGKFIISMQNRTILSVRNILKEPICSFIVIGSKGEYDWSKN
tara:strand:- start:49 stop:282 length:234 start_codon:yes stop_codon:yes gene_type:complete